MDHGIIAILWAAIVSVITFGIGWIFKKGENSGESKVINQQNEETIKDVNQDKKIDEYVDSLNRNEDIKLVREFERTD